MQQVIPSGTTVVVLAQPTIQDKRALYKNMKHGFSKALIGLGAVQLSIGVLCIIFQCVSVGFYGSAAVFSLAFVGHGIWNGLLFFITGIFGILGGSRKSRCEVVSFNVLSIISACFSAALLGIGIPSAIIARCYKYYYRYYYYDYYYYGTSTTADPTYRICQDQAKVVIAMESMLAILAIIEGIVAIVSSAYCCAIGACCCGCGGSCCCPKPPPQPQFVALGEHSPQQFLQQQSSNQWVLAQNQPQHQLNGQAPDAGYQRLYTPLENGAHPPAGSAPSAPAEWGNPQYMDIAYVSDQNRK